MTDKTRILDIAMNLNRIGNWAADGYKGKKKRIVLFLQQTSEYLATLQEPFFSGTFQKTFIRFRKEFDVLKTEGIQGPRDELLWAEKMMTWGNILTHRSQLLSQ